MNLLSLHRCTRRTRAEFQCCAVILASVSPDRAPTAERRRFPTRGSIAHLNLAPLGDHLSLGAKFAGRSQSVHLLCYFFAPELALDDVLRAAGRARGGQKYDLFDRIPHFVTHLDSIGATTLIARLRSGKTATISCHTFGITLLRL
jgi:hypothetical protein